MKRTVIKRQDAVAGEGATPGVEKFLLAVFDRLMAGLGLVSALGLLAVPILVTVDVITRHANLGNIVWVADACEYLLFASTMIGAPWLLHLGRHVRIDILPGILPGQASKALEAAIHLIMLVVCLSLIFYGTEALSEALKYRSMLYKALPMPVWPFIAIYIAAFSMMSLELIVRLYTGRGAVEDEPLHM